MNPVHTEPVPALPDDAREALDLVNRELTDEASLYMPPPGMEERVLMRLLPTAGGGGGPPDAPTGPAGSTAGGAVGGGFKLATVFNAATAGALVVGMALGGGAALFLRPTPPPVPTPAPAAIPLPLPSVVEHAAPAVDTVEMPPAPVPPARRPVETKRSTPPPVVSPSPVQVDPRPEPTPQPATTPPVETPAPPEAEKEKATGFVPWTGQPSPPPQTAPAPTRMDWQPNPPRQKAPPPKDSPEERRLVESARAALAQRDATTCLNLLQQHAQRFPQGRLVEEREALTVLTLAALGRMEEARAAARAFTHAHPESLLLPAVQQAVNP